MRRRTVYAALALVALAAAMGIAAVAMWRRGAPPPVPDPNGYDVLVAAAKRIGNRTDYWDELPSEELAEAVAANEPILEKASKAFRMESAVPIAWENAENPQALSAELDRAQEMRRLYRAFMAAFRHAALEGDWPAATETGLGLFKLARAAGRGGLTVDVQIAGAYRSAGVSALYAALPHLDAAACSDLQRQLSQFEDWDESIDAVMERDWEFVSASRGFAEKLILTYHSRQLSAQGRQQLEQQRNRNLAEVRLLETHLAIRRFELAEGRLPESLDELAPHYLPQARRDPFSDGPLRYRVRDGAPVLYSVGVNRVDDRGVAGKDRDSGDLLLSPLDYAPAAGPEDDAPAPSP